MNVNRACVIINRLLSGSQLSDLAIERDIKWFEEGSIEPSYTRYRRIHTPLTG